MANPLLLTAYFLWPSALRPLSQRPRELSPSPICNSQVEVKSGEWMVICVVLGDGWWKTPVLALLQSHTNSRHADAARIAKAPKLPAI